MKKYRITKYNPAFRNENGEYMIDEWTSIWDIGKRFYNGVLDNETYYETEIKYLQALKYVLDDNSVLSMRVSQLEKYNDEFCEIHLSSDEQKLKNNIKVGSLLDCKHIEVLSRMILREILWGKLESVDGLVTVEFGYDYYMYVICKELSEYTKRKIFMLGLFVEEMI